MQPHTVQIVAVKPSECPECDSILPGVIVSFITNQHFDPKLVNTRALCRECDAEIEMEFHAEHKPLEFPEEPRIKRV